MKKLILAIVALTATGLAAVQAQATESAPVTCSLTFQAKGGGVQVIVGAFQFEGSGQIRCLDFNGQVEELPVNVKMGARPIALNVGIGAMEMAGLATGIGVSTGAEALLGDYLIADAQAGVGIGVGATLAAHGGAEALTLNLGVNVVKGFGAQIGINKLEITAAD